MTDVLGVVALMRNIAAGEGKLSTMLATIFAAECGRWRLFQVVQHFKTFRFYRQSQILPESYSPIMCVELYKRLDNAVYLRIKVLEDGRAILKSSDVLVVTSSMMKTMEAELGSSESTLIRDVYRDSTSIVNFHVEECISKLKKLRPDYPVEKALKLFTPYFGTSGVNMTKPLDVKALMRTIGKKLLTIARIFS